MLGPSEDCLASGNLPAAERKKLNTAHRNSLRLLKLVNSLLDFSRIEAGRAQASYEPNDLAAITTDLASNFRSACERAGLKLVVECEPLGGPAYVDRDMWEKIVLNLLSNAFKFTFEGEIAISLRAIDRHAELEVRDTGVGIPHHELPRLFERFHRIKAKRAGPTRAAALVSLWCRTNCILGELPPRARSIAARSSSSRSRLVGRTYLRIG
jgi:signal transduction histidine kinase